MVRVGVDNALEHPPGLGGVDGVKLLGGVLARGDQDGLGPARVVSEVLSGVVHFSVVDEPSRCTDAVFILPG